jgi:oligoribonuclease NrnB/cAMP/cGMP phosphodiesterase (DHH superfamily)
MKTYILYHDKCCDGFASAWVAWKYFEGNGEKAEYIPVTHGEPVPELDPRSYVYILDFSYSKEQLEELASRMTSVTVLDHHVSALRALNSEFENKNISTTFNMSKSGVGITWNEFFCDIPMPKLLQHVQDRDLWNWNLSASRNILAGLDSFDREFTTWDELICDSMTLRRLESTGAILNAKEDKQIESVLKTAKLISFDEHRVPCVVMSVPNMQSDVGHQLLSLYPESPFAVVLRTVEGKPVICLRGYKEGFDCSKLATKYGGGGHRAAAGIKNSGLFKNLINKYVLALDKE